MTRKKGDPGGGGGQPQQSGRKRKRSRGRKRPDPRKFWGDTETIPQPAYGLRPTEARDALLGSLGRPPIPGHETAARHYFDLVYEKSVSLSFALAAAGGLDKDAPEPLPTFVAIADDEGDEAENGDG